MAEKILKSIKFPGLEDTYIIPDVSQLPSIYSGTEDPRLMEDFGKNGDIYIMYSEE